MACDTTSASSVGLEYMLATGRSTTALGNSAAKRASSTSPVISPLRVPQALAMMNVPFRTARAEGWRRNTMSRPENENQIDYIELPAGNIGAAKQFYGTVFGWTFEDYRSEERR